MVQLPFPETSTASSSSSAPQYTETSPTTNTSVTAYQETTVPMPPTTQPSNIPYISLPGRI